MRRGPKGYVTSIMRSMYLVIEYEEVESEHKEEPANDNEERMELIKPLEHMEISAHALNGSLGFRTLRVIGYHSKKPLHILVDTGNSHNFIDPEVVKELRCQVISTTPQAVTAANGNDMQMSKMCRLSWLLQGVEFSTKFLLLPLGSCGVVLEV
ncbi:hypothetical protein T459_25308 [Capsicum annuum]|uniref:Uncharacterized protein n=1 Tax=Capsicum annuum TaxID=4072 RepID=A0A2G2YKE4_CAPAN|nr:hypothetical protein T459_25308 [Capsicum annuum]